MEIRRQVLLSRGKYIIAKRLPPPQKKRESEGEKMTKE